MTLNKQQQSRAFSLIEAAIVLAILGLVIGGIWAATQSVSNNRKMSAALSGMLFMIDRVGSLYTHELIINTPGADASGGMFVSDVAIAAKAVPADWVNGTNIFDPWGQPFNDLISTLAVTGTPYSTRFILRFQNVTTARCKQLVRRVPTKGLQYIYAAGPNVVYTSFPVDPNGAVCATASQSVSFSYSTIK